MGFVKVICIKSHSFEHWLLKLISNLKILLIVSHFLAGFEFIFTKLAALFAHLNMKYHNYLTSVPNIQIYPPIVLPN